jgi:hypothetical protein
MQGDSLSTVLRNTPIPEPGVKSVGVAKVSASEQGDPRALTSFATRPLVSVWGELA